MLDDGVPTESTYQQDQLEQDVHQLYGSLYRHIAKGVDHECVSLRYPKHAAFLSNAFGKLQAGFRTLDPTKPWVLFWVTHGMNLLSKHDDVLSVAPSLIMLLSACQHQDGGFAGGPGQLPHLAPTYAAVAALVSIGTPEALSIIDTNSLERFLLRMCVTGSPEGGLKMHDHGEVDVRACYLAVATSHMLCLDTNEIAHRSNAIQFIQLCQTYEGGFGGEPGSEAHGGYTYCAVAALAILKETRAVDIPRLQSWLVQRQDPVVGGFNGRTNKLADGCYSFWQGAVFSLLRSPATQLFRHLQDQDVPDLHPDLCLPVGLCGAERHTGQQPAVPQEQQQVNTAHTAGSGQADSAEGRLKSVHESDASHCKHVASSASTAADPTSSAAESLRALLSPYQQQCCGGDDANAAQPHGCSDGGQAQHQPFFSSIGLQLWILVACQATAGLRDKPGKAADWYHTCYCLSGLSVAQEMSGVVLGDSQNVLRRTDAHINVVLDRLVFARQFFSKCGDKEPSDRHAATT